MPQQPRKRKKRSGETEPEGSKRKDLLAEQKGLFSLCDGARVWRDLGYSRPWKTGNHSSTRHHRHAFLQGVLIKEKTTSMISD
jgi:hypothetical protein